MSGGVWGRLNGGFCWTTTRCCHENRYNLAVGYLNLSPVNSILPHGLWRCSILTQVLSNELKSLFRVDKHGEMK